YASPPSEFYILSLHDALPIYQVLLAKARVVGDVERFGHRVQFGDGLPLQLGNVHGCLCSVPLRQGKPRSRGMNASQVENWEVREDRKSTRLNSSHVAISYAVF